MLRTEYVEWLVLCNRLICMFVIFAEAHVQIPILYDDSIASSAQHFGRWHAFISSRFHICVFVLLLISFWSINVDLIPIKLEYLYGCRSPFYALIVYILIFMTVFLYCCSLFTTLIAQKYHQAEHCTIHTHARTHAKHTVCINTRAHQHNVQRPFDMNNSETWFR